MAGLTLFRPRYNGGLFERIVDLNEEEDGLHIIVQSPLPSYPHLRPEPMFSELVHLRNGEDPALVINISALEDLDIKLVLEED